MENICQTCGSDTDRRCSVCGRHYHGQTKEHLRSDIHKAYKSLFQGLRECPDAEALKLAEQFKPKGKVVEKADVESEEDEPEVKPPKKKKVVVKKKESSSESDVDEPKKPKKVVKKKSLKE